MKKTVYVVISFILLLTACESKTGFSINSTKEKLELDQNSTVKIIVQRKDTPTNLTIGLDVEDLPAGVTQTPASARSIASGNTDATLELAASVEAEPGEYDITIKASVNDDVVEEKLILEIFSRDGFIIGLNLNVLSLEQGKTTPLDINVSRDIAFQGDIEIGLKNLPEGVTASPLTISAGQISGSLQLTASAIAPAVSRVVTVEGKANGSRFETSFQLTIETPAEQPSFSFNISPESLDLARGKTRAVNVTIQRKGPFSGPVTITAQELPEGVSLSALTIPALETSGLLALTASDAVAIAQNQAVTLSGQGNADGQPLSANATITLNIVESLGLEVDTSLEGFIIPWDIEFAADGSMYVTERRGTTKRVVDGVITELSNPLDVYVPGGEPGLMGLALDPDFETNNHLYVCYTRIDAGIVTNRVSRLTASGDSLVDELPIVDDIPAARRHVGCRLAFGPDGNLYITTGDADDPDASQTTDSLVGKVLRVARDGSIPADNPFGNAVWAYGLRNSQGLAFHPNGRLYSTEHGAADDDEINLLEQGENYGWPIATGTSSVNGSVPALTAYTPTLAVAGMAIYNGTVFPEWNGDALFVSLKAGQLRRLEFNDDGSIAEDVIILNYDYGRLRDIAVNPVDGKIYIATSNMDGRATAPFDNEGSDKILILSQ